MSDDQVPGCRPRVQRGGDLRKRLPGARRRAINVAEPRCPGGDEKDHQSGLPATGELQHAERREQHGRRKPRQRVAGDQRRVSPPQQVESHGAQNGGRHPEPGEQARAGEERTEPSPQGGRDHHRVRRRGDAVGRLAAAPDSEAGKQAPSEQERGGEDLLERKRLVEPPRGHPPAREAFRYLQVPGQDEEQCRRGCCQQPAESHPLPLAKQPGHAGEPDEGEEVVGEQPRGAGQTPEQQTSGPGAASRELQRGPGEQQRQKPEQRVHPSFRRVVQRGGRKGEEQTGDPRQPRAAHPSPDQPEERQREQCPEGGEEPQRRIAGTGGATPSAQQEVIQGRTRVGHEHRPHHAARVRGSRILLGVHPKGGGRTRRGRLEVVAQGRDGVRGGVLETVTGSHRQRKDLVHPQPRSQREDYPREAGEEAQQSGEGDGAAVRATSQTERRKRMHDRCLVVPGGDHSGAAAAPLRARAGVEDSTLTGRDTSFDGCRGSGPETR